MSSWNYGKRRKPKDGVYVDGVTTAPEELPITN
jgi:hypothetical protein